MEVQMCWKMKKCAEASAAATGVLVTIWGFPENLQSVVIKQVWFIRGWPEMGRWKLGGNQVEDVLKTSLKANLRKDTRPSQSKARWNGVVWYFRWHKLHTVLPATFFPKKVWSRLWIPEHNLWWKTGGIACCALESLGRADSQGRPGRKSTTSPSLSPLYQVHCTHHTCAELLVELKTLDLGKNPR